MTERLSRRTVLGLLGAAGALTVVGGACTVGDGWPAITLIGKAYRARYPAENDASTVAGLLGGANSTATPPTLLAQYDDQIRSDFETGQAIWISGWRLSRTEARIAALWSFSH